MTTSTFDYVTYIRTTPEKLWSALLFPDGRICDSGDIVEAEPNRRLLIRWQNQWKPELQAEGHSLCTMELEPNETSVKLTLTHSMEREGSQLIATVSSFWPMIISNLTSLVETGSVVLQNL